MTAHLDELKKKAFESASPYVQAKVLDMVRRGIPAHVNPSTGAARPDWKEGVEKEEREHNIARFIRKIFVGGRDIEFASTSGRRPRRPLSETDKLRRSAALNAATAETLTTNLLDKIVAEAAAKSAPKRRSARRKTARAA